MQAFAGGFKTKIFRGGGCPPLLVSVYGNAVFIRSSSTQVSEIRANYGALPGQHWKAVSPLRKISPRNNVYLTVVDTCSINGSTEKAGV